MRRFGSSRYNPKYADPVLDDLKYRKKMVFPSSNIYGRITVYRSYGVDSGSDIYVGSNCRPDYNDIRFIDQNGASLPFFNTVSADGTQASYWILLTSGTTVIMLYGCTSIPASAVATTTNSFLKLHVKARGANGSTSFYDDSASHKTISKFGTIQVSTTGPKIGITSILGDGNSDYLDATDSDDWAFGTSDFTVGCWVNHASYPAAYPNEQPYMDQFFPSRSWTFGCNNTGLYFGWSTDGSNVTAINGKAWTPTLGTWYWVSAIRSGTELKIFCNGAQVGTTENISTNSIYNSNQKLFLLADHTTGDNVAVEWHNGKMDDILILKGVALDGTKCPTIPSWLGIEEVNF